MIHFGGPGFLELHRAFNVVAERQHFKPALVMEILIGSGLILTFARCIWKKWQRGLRMKVLKMANIEENEF